jgi:hypothetical protein
MHRSALSAAVLGCAIVLTPLLAACGPDPVFPLPAESPGQSASASASAGVAPVATSPSLTRAASPPATPRPGKPKPTTTRTTRPTTPAPGSTSTCRGAVRYDLDLRKNELALIKSMCFKVGGVLRLQGIGPGLVTVEPSSLVSTNYEGGVVDVRFVRPGTVTVRIPQDDQVYEITVVINA